MVEKKSFLGTGWSFPPEFNKKTGTVELVSGEEDIRQSLEIILSTRPGERVLHPDFGCNLDIMMFEPLTTTLITTMKDIIRTAIILYEPRIELNSVKIYPDHALEGKVNIELDYTVRATNSRFNMVYPFYVEEGTYLRGRAK